MPLYAFVKSRAYRTWDLRKQLRRNLEVCWCNPDPAETFNSESKKVFLMYATEAGDDLYAKIKAYSNMYD